LRENFHRSARLPPAAADTPNTPLPVTTPQATPLRQDFAVSLDLPMLHDIDADYTLQYIKLARVLRDKIESGKYKHGDALPASDLAQEHKVSVRVTWNALSMLAQTNMSACQAIQVLPGDLAAERWSLNRTGSPT
jgi:hypothetical protein